MTLFVNARFLGQPVSGVQRYAREIVGALDALLLRDTALAERLGPVIALAPDDAGADPGWQAIALRRLRGGRGHLWEQGALGRASRGGVLLSLCNAGPLLHRRHAVAFHDAHLWTMPAAFSRRYRAWHALLRPRLARRAALAMTVSRHSAAELSPRLDMPAARFEIVPNAAGHLSAPADPGAALGALGLAPGGYLLAVGNLSPNKNLARLAQAAARAGAAVPPVVVAGGAAPGVARAGAAGLRMLGRVPDETLAALYMGARGLVFPSLNEGFGIPPLEAMALGCPVAAARAGALPEVLGDAALWFDPRDTDDMARGLRDLATLDGPARAAVVARGQARAARFSWDRSAAHLAGLLVPLVADARSSAAEASRSVPRPASPPRSRGAA
ncbi:glycosyltransferase family 1 protein [Palleronia sediminis]|uniref:Glycosyltransferase family 1 protein n=1 Tax=Palleronia sediminis TaxID=2547833 RepID=A0A4R6A7U7_9RHOB|nr:glycosyltransferase family 1 protein [Palleronia sediminis]TDL79861.1 glycosyltransferase family 1 protein [Palleronia sediminis]